MLNTKEKKYITNSAYALVYVFIPAFIIVVTRWYLVENFAGAMPFWDQWDSEWDRLLLPWIKGTLALSDLWQPHNEHRIFPTRIMTLLSFQLSGAWNNLLEARWNIFLAAASPLYILLVLRRNEPKNLLFLPVAVVVMVQAVFPFSWENFLVGFQSQIYFLVLFTVITIGLAAFNAQGIAVNAVIILLGMLSALTMASGLITPIIAASVMLTVAWQDGTRIRRIIWPLIMLAMISVSGLIFLPSNEAHDTLKAENIGQFFRSATRVFCWPSRSRPWTALPLWLPVTIIPWLLIHRQMSRIDVFMTGCFLWTAALGFSIAYGRGHDLMHITSRYTDFLTPGLIASAWFAMKWITISTKTKALKYAGISIGVLFFFIYLRTHIMRVKGDIRDMTHHHELSLIQARNVDFYLRSGDSYYLQQPPFHIPYPDPVRLKKLLDDPVIKDILPDLSAKNEVNLKD